MTPADAKHLAATAYLSDARELADALPPDLVVLCILVDPRRPGEIWVGGNMPGETVCGMLPALHRQHILEHHTAAPQPLSRDLS